jgi:hypothetical protein
MRLNLEIAGIAAFGLAVFFGVSLAAPAAAGAIGAATAHGLSALFGGAAWLVPLLVALVGGIVFLEINVPRMIATLGLAALAYFLIVDTAEDGGGGIVGAALAHGLRSLVGATGSIVVLVVLSPENCVP